MEVAAAEQLFERKDGGEEAQNVVSLLWIDHPQRPLIFLLHDYGHWRAWPDTWDGRPVKDPHPGTVQGFAFLIERVGLGSLLGTFIWPEQSYRAEIEELEGGWRLTDSWGRTLRLVVGPVHWSVERWPE